MTSTHVDVKVAQRLVRAVLVPFERKPSQADIAGLTGQVLHLGHALLPDVIQLRPRSDAALASWERLITDGEERGPFGEWTYARALARTLRTMIELLAQDGAR